ncbi:uncharacterized protein LOC120353576 [Nilaparvata lugens]|uniref:uncharacterized protein LOC120353576 n=1 Tax=Nilaparvata lugens TaxID=108931 RepID=UPI00193D6834|nr:uncharacterized protein LOC120353576 [Nilaparvata lugens]
MILMWVGFLSLVNGYYMPSNISIASDGDNELGLDQFYRNPFYDSKIYNYGSVVGRDGNFIENDNFDYEIFKSRAEDNGKFPELFDFLNNSSDNVFGDYNFMNNEDSDLEMDKHTFGYKPVAKRSLQNEVIKSEYTVPILDFNYGRIHNPIDDKDATVSFMTSLKHPKQFNDFPGNDIEGLFSNKPNHLKSKSEEVVPNKLYESSLDGRGELHLKKLTHQGKPMDIWNNFLTEIMTINKMQKSRINHLPGKDQYQYPFEKNGKKQDDIINKNVSDSSPRNYTSRFQKYMPFLFKNMEPQKKQRKGQQTSPSNKIETSFAIEDSSKLMSRCESNGIEMLDDDYDIDDSNKELFKIYKQSDQPQDEFLTVRLFEHLNNPFPNLFREIPPPSVVANIVNKDVLRKLKNKISGKDHEFYEFKFKKINNDPFPNLFFEKPKLEQEEFVIRKLPMKKTKSKDLN